MTVLLVSPRFFDAVYGERRAMMSAYKTALALSKHVPVVVVTAGPPPRYEKLHQNLTVYRLWDLFLPDPFNQGIVPGLFAAIVRVLKQEKPTAFLVNKHLFFADLAAPFLKLLGKRVVVQTDTFPGIDWFPQNPRLAWLAKLYARTFGMWVLRSADTVVLLHEGLVPTAERLHLPYTVIHNGVDLAAFRNAPPATDIVKKPGEVFLVYVGRLESVKGYAYFLEVAREVTKQFRQVKVFLVGTTAGKEDVVREFASEQIIFTGYRLDVAALLKRMDIFVLPSYAEGLPNALMEAMAVGCVPVASRVGGIPIVARDGKEGLLFKPGDRDDLAGKLTSVIRDANLRQQLSRAARERIAESFDLAKESGKLLKVLQSS